MAGVYREQIIRLHEALNSELETQRQEAAEIVRSLIEAIILTPSDDGMRIDVRGDLAGILTIASETQKSANAGMRSRFDPRSQFEMVAGAGLVLSLRQPQVENKTGLISCFNELFSAHT